MAKLGIKDALAKYGANWCNVQWSVSAWAPDGSSVVSRREHHRRSGTAGSLEFASNASRWRRPANNKFRENVRKACEPSADVRLVIVKTDEVDRVEAGEDASKVKKEFFVRENLVGRVIEWDAESCAFRFTRA
jgi:hypothetical protein